MKAAKTASGKWRVLAYNRYTKRRKSFTAPTRKEAERLGREYEENLTADSGGVSTTFSEACERYIESRTNTCSPRTIVTYRSYQRQYYGLINDVAVKDIDNKLMDELVNQLSETRAPKYVQNITDFAMSVIRFECPTMYIKFSRPKKRKPKLNLPSEATVQKLLQLCEGDVLCVPIYLAAFGCMRRGEIAALRQHNIDMQSGEIDICENLVLVDHKWIRKSPKNGEGRIIQPPAIVMQRIKKYGIPNLSPDAITRRFARFLKANDLPHFRFHDLRHYCAARMLAAGIPIAVVQEYGGWITQKVLLEIYNYVIAEIKQDSMDKWSAIAQALVQPTSV